MSDPPVSSGEPPVIAAAPSTNNTTASATAMKAAPVQSTAFGPTQMAGIAAAPTTATPSPSVNSNTATPASTPTPESTPTTPVANTPTPLQQQQLQQLDHHHAQQHQQQQQQQQAVSVGQPQLATPQQQPQMMGQQTHQQQPMLTQQQQPMPQIQMQQQQVPQLQHMQQLGQPVQQQQLGPQQMQMTTHPQLQQPMMQQQQIPQMQQQTQPMQPTTALQQQLQQPPLQQLQQQVQVVQQQQAQQSMQQMTQNNQNLSIVQSPTTMTGTIQAGATIRTPLGQLGQVQVLPQVNNTGLLQQTYLQQQLMLQDLMNRQINIQPGTSIAVQQSRPQTVTANQQKNGTQQVTTTAQSNNKQGADKTAGGQQQQTQQQQQQGPLIGGKPIIQSQGAQPLVIGRLGVISNQGNMLGTTKAGHVSIAGTSGTQVFNSPTQIRLASHPALVTSTGQIINTQPIMLSQLQAMAQLQQNIPMAGQMLTGIGSQPLYIRTAGPIQGQQGMLGNLQAVTQAQLKGKVDGQRNVQLVKIGRGGKILKGLTRTIQPGQAGRPIQPKGGLPDPNNKPQTLLVTPKNKKQAAASKTPATTTTTTTTTTTANESSSKSTVTLSQATNPKPSAPVKKPEASAPTPIPARPPPPPPRPSPPEELTTNSKTIPPQASVQPIVTAQPAVNGSAAVVDSSGTNGTITVTEIGVVAKTEPMDVDREEADDEEDNTVEMTDLTEESHKGKLKAVIKPHILTHIIDDFVIQEGNEPFPVQKSSLMTEFLPSGTLSDRSDSESTATDGKDRSSMSSDSLRIKCEFCGKMDFAAKFKRSKRFCSISCAKRYNVGCSKRLRLIHNTNGIDHLPTGSKYVKKRKTPDLKKKWKRQEGGRVTTGPIQRTPSQCSEQGAWSSTTSEAASEITTEDEAPSTTDDNTPNEGSPPRSPPVLEREGGPATAVYSTNHSRTPQSFRNQRAGEQVSPGSAGLIVIQPSPGLADSQSSSTSTSSLSAVSPRPAASTSPACHRRHPSTWGVLDVYEFIQSLPGCSPYADEFRSQEIDGQALMLLKEDHLMSAMNMKLGPALKICAKITSLKEELS